MPDTVPIAFDTGFRRRLAVGLVVSALAHLAFGVSLLGRWTGGEAPEAILATLPPPQPETPVVRPGIERSRVVTINWLGFETPTEHAATPAEADQAALSPEPAGVPEWAQPSPIQLAAETPAPIPEPAPEPAPARFSDPAPEPAAVLAREPVEVAPEAVEAPEPAPSELEPAAPALPETDAPRLSAAPLLEIVRQAFEAVAAASREPRQEPAPEEAVSPAPPAPPQSGGAPGSDADPDALPSEKQSSATSREQPLDWAPGRPVAAEGLDIQTVDPRWTIATRLSALPRNPVVRIDFGRDGAVRKVEFLPEQDTGYRDVDGPLLDALYRWTAKGEALAQLPPDDPDAVVSFRIRIILMPSRGTIHRGPRGR